MKDEPQSKIVSDFYTLYYWPSKRKEDRIIFNRHIYHRRFCLDRLDELIHTEVYRLNRRETPAEQKLRSLQNLIYYCKTGKIIAHRVKSLNPLERDNIIKRYKNQLINYELMYPAMKNELPKQESIPVRFVGVEVCDKKMYYSLN